MREKKSNYEKCIKLEMEMKTKNKNIVQIDYNDFIETLNWRAVLDTGMQPFGKHCD